MNERALAWWRPHRSVHRVRHGNQRFDSARKDGIPGRIQISRTVSLFRRVIIPDRSEHCHERWAISVVTGPVFSTGAHDFPKVGIGWPQRPPGSGVRGIRGLSVGTNPWPSSDRFGLYAGSTIRKSPQRSRMISSSRLRRVDRAQTKRHGDK